MSNIRTQCDIDTKPFVCEFCDKAMTEEDHNFCDICDECREEEDYEQIRTRNAQQYKTYCCSLRKINKVINTSNKR